MSGDAFVRSMQRSGSRRWASGDLLVQQKLGAATELSDLVTAGRAPVLRVTVVCTPGGSPHLHSALLAIDVPGEHPRDFIRGQIRVPIEIHTGRMAHGIWFLRPQERFSMLPWNKSPLLGREMPHFEKAIEIVLSATSLIGRLAIVNWDLIVTPDGAVILEGNTCGDWILTNLSAAENLPTDPLAPLLSRWEIRTN
jgi:hypothetical protein